DDRRYALGDVVEGRRILLRLEQPAGARDGVLQRPRQRAFETLAVRATVHVADRVGEALDGALVPGSPPQRDVDLGPTFHIGLHDAVLVGGVLLVGSLAGDGQRAAHGAVPRGREVLDHVGQAVGVVE